MKFQSILLSTATCAAALLAMPAWAQQGGESAYAGTEEITLFGTNLTSVPKDAVTATKSMLPILDTPATVTVISRELIDSQLALDLQDVIRNTSGLNQAGNNYGVGDFLQSRGLPVGYAYDGMYGGAGLGPDSYAPTRSLTNVERIEVVQGSNGTLYGANAAGGLVNLIEKKPQFDAAYAIQGRAGSYNDFSATFDATGPINDWLAYRVVGSILRDDGFRDLSTDRNELYASLRARTDKSNLVLSAAYIDDKVQVDAVGYPVRIFNSASTSPGGIAAGDVTAANLPNDPGSSLQLTPGQIETLAGSLAAGDGLEPFDLDGASLISPLARPNDGEEIRLKARWEWTPMDGLSIVPSTQYREYSSNYVRQTGAYNYVYWNRNGVVNAPPRAPLVVDGELFPFAARRQEYRQFDVKETSWDNFIDITYNTQILGMTNETLVTGYYQKTSADVFRSSLYDADNARSADNPIPYIFDIRDPNFPTGTFEDYDTFVSANYEKDVTSKGVGFQNITYITPWLITRAGVGWNRIRQDFDNGPTETAADRDPVDQTDSGLVFNLGATIKPAPWAAIFIGYGEGRTSFSFGGTLTGDDDRPDSRSTNFEIGVKAQTTDGRLSAGITYFETARSNLRYGNPLFEDNPDDPNFNVSVDEFFFNGADETTGWQFDINYAVTQSLFINANATIQNARNRQNPTSSSFDAKQKGVPDVFASVYGVYELPFQVAGGTFNVNLGYEFQDERTIASAAFGLPDAVLPAQGVWDAGVGFTMDERWSAQLRVINLGNTLAYDRALFLGGQPAAPRSVDFVIEARF